MDLFIGVIKKVLHWRKEVLVEDFFSRVVQKVDSHRLEFILLIDLVFDVLLGEVAISGELVHGVVLTLRHLLEPGLVLDEARVDQMLSHLGSNER